MKILIDAFGGDNAPDEIIAGSLLALEEADDFSVVFVGNEQIVKGKLSSYTYDKNRVEFINATDVIGFDEEPVMAIRTKPEATLVKGMVALRDNEEYNAFVSAGSSGAFLASATLKLGRIPGINRPALCPPLPTPTGKKVLLLDSGANSDCKSINLLQFAIMGSEFYKCVYGVEKPKVALLSNGTEDNKGNELCKEAFPLLKNCDKINFVGNIEARDILSGIVDVVVADGFSGNVALKSCEGTALTIFAILKDEIKKSFKAKIGALFLKDGIKELNNKMNYTKHGGALFLGVGKVVVKSHGSSKRETFKNAVLQAKNTAESGVIEKIKEAVKDT